MNADINNLFVPWVQIDVTQVNFKKKSYYENCVVLCGHELIPEVFQIIADYMGQAAMFRCLKNTCTATRNLIREFGLELLSTWWNSLALDQSTKTRFSSAKDKLILGSYIASNSFRISSYNLSNCLLTSNAEMWKQLREHTKKYPRDDLLDFFIAVATFSPDAQIYFRKRFGRQETIMYIPCGIAANGFVVGVVYQTTRVANLLY